MRFGVKTFHPSAGSLIGRLSGNSPRTAAESGMPTLKLTIDGSCLLNIETEVVDERGNPQVMQITQCSRATIKISRGQKDFPSPGWRKRNPGTRNDKILL